MISHVVQQGDCLASLGAKYGFYWKTIWDHPSNSALVSLRNDPNVLMEGDTVLIPDRTGKTEPRSNNARHQFVLKGVPEQLNLRLLDKNHEPRANLKYTIIIDGIAQQGITTDNGEIKLAISPSAKSGKLILQPPPPAHGEPHVQEEVMALNLGHLDPISEIQGIKARLLNLGVYNGPVDNNSDDTFCAAVRAFQAKQNLPVTGSADKPTVDKLKSLHGH